MAQQYFLNKPYMHQDFLFLDATDAVTVMQQRPPGDGSQVLDRSLQGRPSVAFLLHRISYVLGSSSLQPLPTLRFLDLDAHRGIELAELAKFTVQLVLIRWWP